MDKKEAYAAIISMINSACEGLSPKDEVDVLTETYGMVEMFLDEALTKAWNSKKPTDVP